MPADEDWIAATKPRIVTDDLEANAIPETALNSPHLSLMAKGLYALVLTGQGHPINPYEDAFEDAEDIRAAIDELVATGLAIRVVQH